MHLDTDAEAPVVDVSTLELPGVDGLPRAGDGLVALPVLVDFLASLRPSALPSDFDALELVAAWHAVSAVVAAQQLAAVAELAARPEVYGPAGDPQVEARRAARAPAGTSARAYLGDEVAARLAEGLGPSEARCRAALDLPGRHPQMWRALCRGRVTELKARLLVEGCASLDEAQAREVDARVATLALRQPPARFRQSVRRAVLRVDPATAALRRERAEADRCVRLTALDDGMVQLWALLPALAAARLGRALDSRARAAKAAGDERTLDQLRADALTEGVTGSVEVQVVVPASVLLGVGDSPADLVGYGPVDADLARTLARDATWRRLVADPDDGTLLTAGTATYRPGVVLSRHVSARDVGCRFPMCDRPADRCDLDHTVPFDGVKGLTVAGNLGPVCEHHHQLKHAVPAGATGPPRLEQPEPGRFRWTMPTGHLYDVGPPPLLDLDDPLLDDGSMVDLDDPLLDAEAGVARAWSPVEHAVIGFMAGYHAGRRAA